eukprot:s973_g5.t1
MLGGSAGIRTRASAVAELEDEEEQEPSQAQEHVQGRRTRFQEDAETEPQDEVKPTISVTSPPNDVDKQYSTGVSGRRTDHKLLEAYLQEIGTTNAAEMEAEELDDHPDQSNKRNTNVSQRRKSHRSVRSRQSVMSTQKGSKRSPLKRARIESDATEGSPVQAGRFRPDSAPPKRNSQMKLDRGLRKSPKIPSSQNLLRSAKSGNSVKSKHTIASVASAISSMTSLAEAGMHFEHHFSVNASLRPKIATIGGQRKAPAKKISQSSQKKISQSSQQSKDRETVLSNLTASALGKTCWNDGIRWWVPPGYRLPALLISVAYFCSHCSYMMATSMYALYYREQHGWSMAMYAGFCQCAGENLAGIAMRLVSTPFGSTAESVEEKSPCWRRLSNFLFSKPYDVAWCLFFWACLNAGFMSPWTPGTVIAHVLMASIYVILSKNAMEMCLLYAKGDPDLFLTLQNLARNVEQSGAALACAAGPLLYDFVHPNAPFIVTASGCGAFLIIYTVAVCACVLLPDGYEDEDTVEEYVEWIRIIATLPKEKGRLYRSKGVLAASGRRRKLIFHAVADVTETSDGPEWGADEERICKMVFIGKALARQEIEERFLQVLQPLKLNLRPPLAVPVPAASAFGLAQAEKCGASFFHPIKCHCFFWCPFLFLGAGTVTGPGRSAISMSLPKPPSSIANGEFTVEKMLGAGCFGQVWRGWNRAKDLQVAIKFEDNQGKSSSLQLHHEQEVLTLLANSSPQ